MSSKARRERIAALALPTQLSMADLTFHHSRRSKVESAQDAWNEWLQHLASVYQLSEGDHILPDGKIVRAPKDAKKALKEVRPQHQEAPPPDAADSHQEAQSAEEMPSVAT